MKVKLFLLIILFVAVVGIGGADDLLDQCAEQLYKTTKAVKSLLSDVLRLESENAELLKENAGLLKETVELNEKNEQLLFDAEVYLELLGEIEQQLVKNNEVLAKTQDDYADIYASYSELQNRKVVNRNWIVGAAVSYGTTGKPGGEVIGGYLFKRFGFYTTMGVNQHGYLSIGVVLRK